MTKKKRKRVYIPQNHSRQVQRGTEWLKRIREGLERGQSTDDVIEGMIQWQKKKQ